MKITKQVVSNAPKCYSLAPFWREGNYHFLVATEKLGPCQLFDENGTLIETVWTQPGGVMTMVQVPNCETQFLATQEFYSPNDSARAKIVIATRHGENNWSVRTLARAPFVHRFGLLQREGIWYLLVCCLKSGHQYKDDWTMPGKVFAAELPDDLSVFDEDHQLPLTEIKGNLYHNHGYSAYCDKGINTALVTCDDGVFQFTPPPERGAEWGVRQLYHAPVSDAVLCDFDGDGEPELGCIAPFHGDKLFICRKNKAGAYERAWELPYHAKMLHATCACTLQGKKVWIVGYRKGSRNLMLISFENGSYQTQILDENCGSANAIHFINQQGEDVIVSANREIDEAAIYTVTP